MDSHSPNHGKINNFCLFSPPFPSFSKTQPPKTSSECNTPCASAYSSYHPQHSESHSSDDDRSYNVNTSMERKQAHQVHQLSKKRSRNKINKRLRILRSLIPNCTEKDKATVLDEAIEYLKSLQLQLQIMPYFAGLCVPPTQMMLPTQYPMIGAGAGCSSLQLFGLPFAGYGARFQMPQLHVAKASSLPKSAQQP